MVATNADLTLEVATPLGLALRTEAESVQAPSVDGEFGVFPGHLPLLAALQSGLLKYRVRGRLEVAAVGPGFVEAGPEKVLLLTDQFVRPDDVDAEATRSELSALEQRMKQSDAAADSGEFQELLRAAQWARARLDAWGSVRRA